MNIAAVLVIVAIVVFPVAVAIRSAEVLQVTPSQLQADLERVIQFALEHGDDDVENAAIRARIGLAGGIDRILAAILNAAPPPTPDEGTSR